MNIIEELRKQAIEDIFELNSLKKVWGTWKSIINKTVDYNDAESVFSLGDKLAEVFFSSKDSGNSRTQSSVSAGGTLWEALVCWYLNLCNIGRRVVIIKQKKKLIPAPITNAIAVNYGNFTSNTEADLIAIVFPDYPEFTSEESDCNLEQLVKKYISKIEVHVIQCKTNWNDNAQIPMLWDMVYSAKSFNNTNLKIGKEGYQLKDLSRFSYSFVTVPTVDASKIKITSTSVKRVTNLSGGNYWGYPSKSGIAKSIKEMSTNLFSDASDKGLFLTIANGLEEMYTKYAYFNI